MKLTIAYTLAMVAALVVAPAGLATGVLVAGEAPSVPAAPAVPPSPAATNPPLVDILTPSHESAFAPNSVITVRWKSLFNDFTGLSALYVAELRDGGGRLVAVSRAYECGTPAPLTFVCWTTLTLPEQDGEFEIRVRLIEPTLDNEFVQPPLNEREPREDNVVVYVDMQPPVTTLEVMPAEAATAWSTSTVAVALTCADATTGCGDISYRVNGGPRTIYEGAFMLPADGVHTLSYWSVDLAGNLETARVATLRQDRVAPTATLVLDHAADGLAGWHVTPSGATGLCADATSGCVAASETFPPFGADGEHVFHYAPADVAGHVAEPAVLAVRQDSTPPVIGDVCATVGSDCATSGTLETSLVTVLAPASDAGSGLSVHTLWATSDCGAGSTAPVEVAPGSDGITLDLRPIADNPATNVYQCGAVRFHARAVDVAGLATEVTSIAFVLDTTGPANILLTLANDPSTLVPNGQTVPLTYKAEWIGGALFGGAAQLATVTLSDANDPGWSASGSTDLSGLVTFALAASDTARLLSATVSATAPSDPQTYLVTPPAPLGITWTGIALARMVTSDLPRATLWANVGEIYSPAFSLVYTYDPTVPVRGAVVKLSSPAGDFSALTNSAGFARVPTRMLAPAEVAFDVTACFNPADGPEQCTTGDAVTLRWARLVFDDIDVAPATNGWYNVGDVVTFAFEAVLDYGAGSEPASGATVRLVLGDVVQDLALDGAGAASTTAAFDVVTDLRTSPVSMARLVPTGSPVLPNPPPSGLAFDAASGHLGRLRWTEIALDAGADDTFVNVGDAIGLSIEALWAHDEDGNGLFDDPVSAAAVNVLDAGSDVMGTCAVIDGFAACSIALAQAYAAGQILVVDSSSTGVTRQLGGADATLDLIWTRIVVSGCAIDDLDGIVNVGDTVALACDATYEHDAAALVPAADLALAAPLPSGCEVSSATIVDGLLEAAIACGVRANLGGPQAASFAVATANDDVTDTLGDIALAAKWAEVVFLDLATSPDTDGWYDATDGVVFAFAARLVYGPEAGDFEPADGAVVVLTAGEHVEELTTDASGDASTTLTFDVVTDVVPSLAAVSTPEGVTRYVAADFGRERWTEIALSAVADDLVVNVGDTVTLDLGALWMHDENGDLVSDDPVPSATVEVRDDADVVLTTCAITNGMGTCDVTVNEVYNGGLTLAIVDSSTGVTRQAGGVDLAIDVVWTGVVIAADFVEDAFVNVGDAVRFTALATYAHDGSPVDAAALALGAAAPEHCTLVSGAIENGALEAVVVCSDVTDGTIPLVIATSDKGVTTLEIPLGFHATWTELIVSYTTSIPAGTLLDHNAPVVFTGTVNFAHDIVTGTPPPPGTFFAFFVRTAEDGEEFNCVTAVDDTSCPVEVSKVAGSRSFEVSAASIADTDGDGYVELDITRMEGSPAPVSYRWTSIGFLAFECKTARSGPHACGSMAYDPRELVTVTVTAVAADAASETLPGATITLAGKTLTTNGDGEASRQFVRFNPGCVTVTARGVSATIAGQTVTWDSPRPQEICWA